MMAMEIKSLLPESLLSRAYEFNSEFAWRPEDLRAVADELREKNIAVLGGEVWLKTDSGPMITSDIYQWSIEKNANQRPQEFASRSLDEMIKFGESLSREPKLKERWP